MNPFYRNIPILAFGQAMMMSATSLMITSSALVGYALADDKSLATLPLAAGFVAVMLTSIPAAWLMHRIGRKHGFMLATLFGVAGGSLATWSILNGQFWGFVAAASLTGMYNGFGNYYRFAAADAVQAPLKGRAISFIMAGGVIAAFVGPNLANISRDWISSAEFAGSYAAIIALYLLTTAALSFLKLPHQAEDLDDEETPRPLWQIARQPRFIIALICGTLGYGIMSLIMTATPLAMDHHAHHFDETSFVIQWHVLGMFAPSFFTGFLIERFGLRTILRIGTLFGFGCVAINLGGTSVWHFWTALFLLGLSWNFLFIGATTLLTQTYTPSEKARTQASNDFAVFTTVTLSSLSAGALQHHFGWQMVNIGVLPLLTIVWLAVVALKFVEQDAPAQQAAKR
jgi:MFS family permease